MTSILCPAVNYESIFTRLKKIVERKLRVLILVDAKVANQKYFKTNIPKFYGRIFIEHINLQNEPTYDDLEKLYNRVRNLRANIIFGIGGGSIMDLAKGISILHSNYGPAISYKGFEKVKRRGLPLILVPTIAGSGSEVTSTASFIDAKEQIKLGINGRYVGGDMICYDYKFLQSAPEKLIKSCQLDALVHLIEACSSKNSNLMAKYLAYQGLICFFKASKMKASKKKFELIFSGSGYAAFAMANAGGGVTSGLSYPLGVIKNIPHAIAGGYLLPHIIAHHLKKGYFAAYAYLNNVFTPNSKKSEKANACLFLKKIKSLFYKRLIISKSCIKITKIESKKLVREFFKTRKANFQADPVVFKKSELEKILCLAFK